MQDKSLYLVYFRGSEKDMIGAWVFRDRTAAKNLESRIREIDPGRFLNVTTEKIHTKDDIDSIIESILDGKESL